MCKLLNATNHRMASVFYKTPDCSNVPDDSGSSTPSLLLGSPGWNSAEDRPKLIDYL